MPLDLTHPWFADGRYLEEPAGIVADLLQDHNATAADVAVLFAGTQPGHADGITQETVALWLVSQGQGEHASAVNAQCIREYNEGGTRYWDVSAAVSKNPFVHFDYVHAVREMKRRVLSLPWAADVRVMREVARGRKVRVIHDALDTMSFTGMRGTLEGLPIGVEIDGKEYPILPGCVPNISTQDGVIVVTVELAAAQLITPEPPHPPPFRSGRGGRVSIDGGPTFDVGEWRVEPMSPAQIPGLTPSPHLPTPNDLA